MKNRKEGEKTVITKEEYIENIIDMVKHIEDEWILNQIYRCIINITN